MEDSITYTVQPVELDLMSMYLKDLLNSMLTMLQDVIRRGESHQVLPRELYT
jgi:hypothetical protein